MTELKFMRIVGENIKRELDESRMTQNELSKLTGISKSTISRYINGEIMPSFKNIHNIADALFISLDDLTIGVNEMID